MIGFIAGVFVGMVAGIMTVALCTAAAHADSKINEMDRID